MRRILKKFGSSITAPSDLVGNVPPSALFYVQASCLSGLLSNRAEHMLSKTSRTLRRLLHPLIMPVVPGFMEYKHVFESKNALLGIDEPDKPLELPKEAVIWCSNHGFADDVPATIHTTRHSYIFFGGLPVFYNTLDGLALFLNGVILCNRKLAHSRKASLELAIRSLRQGNDLTIFSEGGWNKTPDKLILDLWPGVYRMASRAGCMVVPVIHYLADPHKKYDGNVIHTVIADPVRMDGLTEKEGLALLRDTMATWYYRMMERYGHSTRRELLQGYDSAEDAWESYISMHTGFMRYYDKEIELRADYRPRDIVRPEEVWASVANIKNVNAGNVRHILFAKELIAQAQKRDFQRRF